MLVGVALVSRSRQEDLITRLAELMRRHQPAVALTGAGISTESGIPDFRSPDTGLWSTMDPVKVASVEAFFSDPGRFWEGFGARFGRSLGAEPNRGHLALARLESAGFVRCVITQNVDGLHQRAGSPRVWESPWPKPWLTTVAPAGVSSPPMWCSSETRCPQPSIGPGARPRQLN